MLELTAEQRSSFVDLCLKRGDAPIKPEHLLCVLGKGAASYQPLRDTLGLNTLPSVELSVELPELQEGPENEKKRTAEINSEDFEASKRLSTEDKKPFPRQRGQNRDRRANLAVQIEANARQLCNMMSQTNGSCDKGDGCRSVHDRFAFMKVGQGGRTEKFVGRVLLDLIVPN